MALSTKVGTFTVFSSTGNRAYTGVGFQPKALMVWGNKTTADVHTSGTGAPTASMPMTIMGITDGTTSACLYQSDNFSAGDPMLDTTNLAVGDDGFASYSFKGQIVSLDSDGFTINWTTASATAYRLNYLALGGSDITNAKIVSWTPITAPGNQTVTGAGFQPDAAIILHGTSVRPSAGNTGIGCFGFTSGSSAYGAMSSNFDSVGSTIGRYQRNDQIIAQSTGNSLMYLATLSSFNSDGFVLNYGSAQSFVNQGGRALVLKGARFKAGSFTQKTSTGTLGTTGIGFQPSAVLFGSEGFAHSTSIDTTRIYSSIGGTDGTNQSWTAMGDNNFAVVVSDTANVMGYYADDATPTKNSLAALSSFDSDGFTLNWSSADATAREIIYFAIGPTPIGSGTTYTKSGTGLIG